METHLRASTATWSGSGTRARKPAPARRERLGVYAVKRLLGEGGMARVYLGENTIVERPVAIKRLLPELGHVAEAHALLLREARTASAIRHPNLLEIYDFGYDTAGRPYIVMELVEGETLAARIEHGPVLTSQALDIAIALADAVAAVHREGFLHRDIKSDNVMLARDDRRVIPKLIDFGIACRIDDADEPPESGAGTPTLMAPEQVAREPIHERTDVWGLGVILYEMLAGRLPFDDNLAIVTDPPHPLPDDVHPEVRDLALACLAKEPDDRPWCAALLAAKLRDVQARYLAARGMIPREG